MGEKIITNASAVDLEESPISQILKAQYDYQTRAFEEYMKYLNILQGTVGPYCPGTVMKPKKGLELEATSEPGTTVELNIRVENKQLAYSIVAPQMTPFIAESGVTWFAETAFTPASILIAPEEMKPITIQIKLPKDLPNGLFHGSLMLVGFRSDGIPVKINVRRKKAKTPGGVKTKEASRAKQ